MADGTLQILGLGTSAVPLEYTISGNQPLDLIAVKADFDGSGAGSDFVPMVAILSSAGLVMAQSKGPAVTAGDSATVTFATFLGGANQSAAGGGIEFDKLNQGGALDIRTADSAYSTVGFHVSDQSTLGINIVQDANGPVLLNATGDGGVIVRSDGNGELLVKQTGDGGLKLQDSGNGGLKILDFGNGGILIQATNRPTVIDMTNTNDLRIPGLPSADPGFSGSVWYDPGADNVLKYTP